MNKKGFVFTGIIAVFIIALMLVLGFLISSKIRWVMFGIGAMAGAIYLISKLDQNKQANKIKLTFAIILFAGAFGLIFASGVLQSQIGDNYIQAPTFYYYECSPASQPVESTHVSVNNGNFIYIPSNTDTADLWIAQTEQTAWYSNARRIVYQICHASGSCDPSVTSTADKWFIPYSKSVPTVHISNLIIGDKVKVNYQSQNLLFQWKDTTGAEYYHTYKPFILWKVDMFGGGRTEYTTISQGCNFPTSSSQIRAGQTLTTSSDLLNSITNSIKQISTQTSTSNTKLDFYKTRNFIGTYVPISASNVNFVTYSGKEGYCLNRQIFAITTAVTNGGTYKIIDSNFNTRLASSVECCPNEKEPTRICNSQFKWENIEVAECSTFKPCAGADWSVSQSKTLIRYNCVNSRCIGETKSVECTTNSDCESNQVCDTKLYECIDVIQGVSCLPTQTLINGICVDNENACKWYQEVVPAGTIEDCGFLGWKKVVPFVSCETKNYEASCKTASWWLYIIIGSVIFILGIIVIMIWMPKRRKR